MKYPWVLQVGVKTKVWWFLVFSGVVYVAVVTRARMDPYHLDAMGFRLGYYTKMKYPWVLQVGVKTLVWCFLVFSGEVYVSVVTPKIQNLGLRKFFFKKWP